jgi:hypothetical protein
LPGATPRWDLDLDWRSIVPSCIRSLLFITAISGLSFAALPRAEAQPAPTTAPAPTPVTTRGAPNLADDAPTTCKSRLHKPRHHARPHLVHHKPSRLHRNCQPPTPAPLNK